MLWLDMLIPFEVLPVSPTFAESRDWTTASDTIPDGAVPVGLKADIVDEGVCNLRRVLCLDVHLPRYDSWSLTLGPVH